jgi:hypothetical protein
VFFVSLVFVRFKAFILLVSVIAYLGEWTAMPGRLVMTAPKTCSSPKTCFARDMKDVDHSQCPRQGKENNEAANCCLNCPLCYMTILPCDQEAGDPVMMVKKLYPIYQSTYVYGYHADAWKPPNRA